MAPRLVVYILPTLLGISSYFLYRGLSSHLLLLRPYTLTLRPRLGLRLAVFPGLFDQGEGRSTPDEVGVYRTRFKYPAVYLGGSYATLRL